MKNEDDYESAKSNFPPGAGNFLVATSYLASWKGPVNETDDTPFPNVISQQGLTAKKHIQKVIFLPERNRNVQRDNIFINYVKNVITDYGGVSTSMLWDSDTYINPLDSIYHSTKYYNADTHSYYYSGNNPSTSHSVLIVGWNDDYPASNFNAANMPPGNGAFIIKNSYGTGFGDNGYCYVSYYDKNLGTQRSAVFTAESNRMYDYLYEYDKYGLVDLYGFDVSDKNTAWFANVFDVTSGTGGLAAVSFYTWVPNATYEVQIHKNPNSGPINTNGYASRITGTLPNAGYHTIPLNNWVLVQNGDRFSAVVKLTTPGWDKPVPLECPDPDGMDATYTSANVTASPGQSWARSDSGTWQDMTSLRSNANVCLKAFVGHVNSTVVSENIPSQMTPGSLYDVSITLRNSGTLPWSDTYGVTLQGIPKPNGDASDFNAVTTYRIADGVIVKPGDAYTFNFRMTAPITGNYVPRYRINWDNKWYGAIVEDNIIVSSTPTVTPTPNPVPGNLIQNPSFEDGETNWSREPGDGTVSVVSDGAQGTANSLRLYSTTYNNDTYGMNTNMYSTSDGIATLRYYVKGTKAVSDPVYVKVQAYSSSGTWLGTKQENVGTVTSQWQQKEIIYDYPAGTAKTRIDVVALCNTNLNFDDFSLTIAGVSNPTPTPTATPAPTPTPIPGNILLNPGLEDGIDGDTHWHTEYGQGVVSTAGTARSGSKCLNLTSNYYVNDAYGAHTDTYNVSGSSVTLKYYVMGNKATNDNVVVKIQAYDDNGWTGTSQTNVGVIDQTRWTEKTMIYGLPAGTSKVRIDVVTLCNNTKLWFDDFSLTVQ